MNGWVKLHRKLLLTELWNSNEPFDQRSAWIDLILRAAHAEQKVNGITLTRGQLITSRAKLAEHWHWSERKVRTFLAQLEKVGQIFCIANNRFTIITLNNYSVYQDKIGDQQNDQQSDQQNDQQATSQNAGSKRTFRDKRPTGDQQSDQQNDQQNDHIQEDKEDKEYICCNARAKQTFQRKEVNQDCLPQEMPIPGGEAEEYLEARKIYESNIGPLTPMIDSQLRELTREVGLACIERAVRKACTNGARRYRYVDTVAHGLAAGIDYDRPKGGDIWGKAYSDFTGGNKNGKHN